MVHARGLRLSIRLTHEEKAMIIRAANKDCRTSADWARLVLLAACQEADKQERADLADVA